MDRAVFEARIPERKMKGTTGKVFTFPARTDVFVRDENGQWSNDMRGNLSDDDVIDICKAATNWSDIRSRYFLMEGFHDTVRADNSYDYKTDY